MRSSATTLLDRPLGRGIEWNWEKTLYLALIVLAIVTRLWGLGIRVQSHDESLHTKYSWNLYAGEGFRHTPLMHGPLLFHATAFSYFLFGDNDFTARLFVALVGVAVVAFPYLLRRWIGRVGALVASFFLLISPSITYYSRYIRHDLPAILWALVMIFAVFSYLRDGRRRWIYLMAAGIALSFTTKEVAFIYNAIIGFFLVGLFAWRSLLRDWGKREELKSLLGVALVVVAVGLLVLGLGVLSGGAGEEEAGAALPWWGLVGGATAAGALLAGVAVLLIGSWETLGEFRSFDLIIVLGTLCLPFLSPLAIKVAGLDPVDYGTPTIYYSGAILGATILASAVIGLAWSWRDWSIAAAIHYAISVTLFTTVFTNGDGIATGFVGSFGYWLAQQGVKRGGQPWYYYGIIVPLYDYLPLVLTGLTGLWLAVGWAVRGVRSSARIRMEQAALDGRRLFVAFLVWWIATAWMIYSYAGEKMPWLSVHLALPMILFAAWGVGRFLEGVAWQWILRERAWIAGLLAPALAMALGTLIYAAASGPFQGDTLVELSTTGQFLGALVATVGFGAGLGYVVRQSGWRAVTQVVLLVALFVPILLTIRHAWHFNYINYGYPIEHLVYAHAAPSVKETMREIEELSRRVTGGPKLIEVAYGADGSWPFHWYLRDYENAVFYGEDPSREQVDAPVVIAGRGEWDKVAPYVKNDYVSNTYTYLWWPAEDYKNLTWKRIWSALTDPEMRTALWRIWYARDYNRYDEVTGETRNLDEWPLRSDYRMYVRRDVVAQMWDRGTLGPEALTDVEPYGKNELSLTARKVIGTQGPGRAEFEGPRGVSIGPDGSVYVADAGNHRIQVFSSEGEFMDSWGARSVVGEESGEPGGFLEPWAVAVDADGTAYVADTWNHRVQAFDKNGYRIKTWGVSGEFGPEDGEAGRAAFFGPRGIVAGPAPALGEAAATEIEQGEPLVYVADTGNKRIQVFKPNGAFAFQWGGRGAGEGNLEEPVGIALGPEGEIYVADTWNRRVQVFDAAGRYLREWPIHGWDSGIPEEKPYLAVDEQGRVYVTDPGNYRVLVFDREGNYMASFGDYGTDEQSFALPQGIAVGDDGSVYVTDAHGHRVLIFDPIDFEGLEE